MHTPALVQTLRADFLRHRDDFVCAYLYGSLARGEGRPRSDADVAVLYKDSPPPTLDGLGLDLSDDLERLLGRRVDVVVLNRAPVDLIHRILRDAILLYEGDRSARLQFEVKARAEYFDLLPYLRQYRRAQSRPQP